MSTVLKGTGVALVTPFNQDGTIDFAGLSGLVDFCVEGTIDYLVVLGTTGESVTLSADEKQAVIDCVIKSNRSRLPLVLGIGGNNTAAIIEEIQSRDLSSFEAILSVVPMYNKPTQEGIYQHYKMLSEATSKSIVLYNVPSRTGSNMTAETTLRLAQLNNVIGIKEATSDVMQLLKILKDRPKDFLVISGDDALALPAIMAGGDGVISVIGQGLPEEFSEMVRLGLSGKGKEAFEILYRLLPIIDYAFEEGNPAGIKQILKERSVCESYVRLPLIKASSSLSQKIEKFLHS
ncbi:4-hydroxy-tetrahydrodipicolinate synthase [Aquimarina intermedia]|uniref:4-hydroxy-tetrahydrodipicolinate synthase n=1 Tax=Aquimarina intermedia TaxID=350814 RepID=A0A5S5BZ04_9FLAO|nr:4-hydroxy-tetrahydrodipicolinate synthase [Aquimarina intermedia]TYP72274.1 4-hydroxy-tetrahydrodipicolinate synthase [Aquimarina intermedia]